MKAIVDGVYIDLTESQIKLIRTKKEEQEKRLEKESASFKSVLRRHGFRKINDLPSSYEHVKNDWFADIFDRGGWHDVWVVGQKLKQGAFPGGWIYSSPRELNEALTKDKNDILSDWLNS